MILTMGRMIGTVDWSTFTSGNYFNYVNSNDGFLAISGNTVVGTTQQCKYAMSLMGKEVFLLRLTLRVIP